MITLPERLKLLRKERHMTQIQLAELLNQAPHASQYYEAGANFPELPKLIALADFYNVSLDYLIGRSETRERQP